MGRAVQQLVADRTDCTIAAGVDLIRDASAAFPNYTQIEAVEEPVDVIVDFSHPSLLTPILSYAAQKGGIPAVLCTTGYSAEQVEALKAAAQTQPVFYSRNMSLGINLLIELSKKAAKVLGGQFDIEIIEKHHNQKIDAPSGTALMLADAIATTTGAICGTSTVTTFVESSAGVAEGGRTGLAAMATAALFFIAMFLSPIASLIPTAATAAALIYVGVLMINCVKDLDWMDPSVALPSFLTMAMMPFTYNISYGIAFGLISYVLIRIFTGKIREVKVGTWVITILFLLMLFLTH